MSQTRLWVAATIIACIILGWFAITAPHTKDVLEPSLFSTEKKSVPSVGLRDSYKKEVHTITGVVEVPNACTTVSAQSSLVDTASSTKGILVEVTLSEDSGICLQRVESIRFTTTLTAPANLPITTTVNGSEASTTDL